MTIFASAYYVHGRLEAIYVGLDQVTVSVRLIDGPCNSYTAAPKTYDEIPRHWWQYLGEDVIVRIEAETGILLEVVTALDNKPGYLAATAALQRHLDAIKRGAIVVNFTEDVVSPSHLGGTHTLMILHYRPPHAAPNPDI